MQQNRLVEDSKKRNWDKSKQFIPGKATLKDA